MLLFLQGLTGHILDMGSRRLVLHNQHIKAADEKPGGNQAEQDTHKKGYPFFHICHTNPPLHRNR